MPHWPVAIRSKWSPMIFSALVLVLPLTPATGLPAGLMHGLQWLGVLVFLGLFAAALESIRRRRPFLWVVAGMTLLGLAFVPFDSAGAVFFIYACALVPWATNGKPRHTGAIVACILGALSIEVWLAGLSVAFWLSSVGWCLAAAVGYLWAVNAMLSIDRLAKMAERERIGQDLHDVLGHTLSLITLKAELAGQLLNQEADIGRAGKEVADIEAISRGALAEVRQTINGYRAEPLEAEIERAAHLLRAAGISASCSYDGVKLDAAREGVVGLALREAVTNVVRHARARACRICIRQLRQVCLLEVQDDGLGGAYPEGHGLRGMRQRIEAFGGSLVLDRAAQGTHLTVRVPMPSAT